MVRMIQMSQQHHVCTFLFAARFFNILLGTPNQFKTKWWRVPGSGGRPHGGDCHMSQYEKDRGYYH